MKQALPARIYDKYRNGDPLSDTELDVGIEHFRKMSQLLAATGPAFLLATGECYRVLNTLEGYKLARTSK